ncbi:hypothetical protein DRJ27_05960 [Candidatus Acetothermia bacterium]|nr:MAG: hypothetical protein DRJ27_05960 [Candidatus Acetothermia bacterium]
MIYSVVSMAVKFVGILLLAYVLLFSPPISLIMKTVFSQVKVILISIGLVSVSLLPFEYLVIGALFTYLLLRSKTQTCIAISTLVYAIHFTLTSVTRILSEIGRGAPKLVPELIEPLEHVESNDAIFLAAIMLLANLYVLSVYADKLKILFNKLEKQGFPSGEARMAGLRVLTLIASLLLASTFATVISIMGFRLIPITSSDFLAITFVILGIAILTIIMYYFRYEVANKSSLTKA